MREWELSYRLGLQRNLNNIICCATSSNASPEESLDHQIPNSRESGELSRKSSQNFSLPESETLKNIIEKRKKNSNVYLNFINKMIEKQNRYQEITVETANRLKKCFQDKKTNTIIYLEKHRITPGYEGGTYETNNVILLTFPEHAMAHYLRYLQYGKVEDLRAYRMMLSDSNEEIRRERATLAGQIGGPRQQASLREQNLGWYNSDQQRERGLRGAATARERGVGAFDPQNLVDANEAWRERYNSDAAFRTKNQKNLFLGTLQRFGIAVSYYDKKNRKIREVRYDAPYTAISAKKGVEYTEKRIHMSEDFFWYHEKFADRPGQSYSCRNSKLNES